MSAAAKKSNLRPLTGCLLGNIADRCSRQRRPSGGRRLQLAVVHAGAEDAPGSSGARHGVKIPHDPRYPAFSRARHNATQVWSLAKHNTRQRRCEQWRRAATAAGEQAPQRSTKERAVSSVGRGVAQRRNNPQAEKRDGEEGVTPSRRGSTRRPPANRNTKYGSQYDCPYQQT
ncbi:hypothetical protein MRX96_003987 [Rhipicephalus microplus]